MKRHLTAEQVREIRIRYAALPTVPVERFAVRRHGDKVYRYPRPNKVGTYKRGVSELAAEFNMKPSNIYPLVRGITYADIP